MKQFIDLHFQPEMAAIKLAMREWNGYEYDEESNERSESLRRLMEAMFQRDEYFYVAWSIDGHHGARSLKRLPEAFQRFSIPTAAGPDDSTLYYGQAESGKKLVVYEGWVRNGLAAKHFEIVFPQATIEELINGSHAR